MIYELLQHAPDTDTAWRWLFYSQLFAINTIIVSIAIVMDRVERAKRRSTNKKT